MPEETEYLSIQEEDFLIVENIIYAGIWGKVPEMIGLRWMCMEEHICLV